MHAVILAAGEGSRMGDLTNEVPKAFMEIEGRSLYERQREAIDPHVDGVTVVLGYRHENVVDQLGPARTVIVETWREHDNAESLYRALDCIDDEDVLVLNGDVVVAESAIDSICRSHQMTTEESVVAHLPTVQSEHTAIQLDDGRVVNYGEITGYRHAGLGILDRNHIDAAANHLRGRRTEWYPSMYLAVPTRGVEIPSGDHIEINRPQDKQAAQGRLPLS